jgi:hypothetical protein
MWRVVLWLLLFAPAPAIAADRPDALARARLLYNLGDYDAAVAAAEEGGRAAAKADAATLIVARAYLEKFRLSRLSDDLTRARESLQRLEPARLTSAERVEWVVGLGQALYFDGASGAAGEMFDSVLDDESLEMDARERVLDWWASALDEEARSRQASDRTSIYQRVRERMRGELSRHPASAAASYWMSAAARGEGDLQAAWDAAQAGWVRSVLSGERAGTLREDLDRLVVRALVPERARATGQSEEELLEDTSRWQN